MFRGNSPFKLYKCRFESLYYKPIHDMNSPKSFCLANPSVFLFQSVAPVLEPIIFFARDTKAGNVGLVGGWTNPSERSYSKRDHETPKIRDKNLENLQLLMWINKTSCWKTQGFTRFYPSQPLKLFSAFFKPKVQWSRLPRCWRQGLLRSELQRLRPTIRNGPFKKKGTLLCTVIHNNDEHE